MSTSAFLSSSFIPLPPSLLSSFHGCRSFLVAFQFTLEILPSFCDFILSFFALISASPLVLSHKIHKQNCCEFISVQSLKDTFLFIVIDKTCLLFPWFPFTGAFSPCFLLGLELQSLNLHWLLLPITLNKFLVFRISASRLSGSYYRDSHF